MALSPEILRERAIAAENRLRDDLKQPITITMLRYTNGTRDIEIRAPWVPSNEYDVTLGDDPQVQVNNEGGIRMACTGYLDYYCNVGAREARLFAWEVALAAEIADRWEEFWEAPNLFLDKFPNPQNYFWELITA